MLYSERARAWRSIIVCSDQGQYTLSDDHQQRPLWIQFEGLAYLIDRDHLLVHQHGLGERLLG